MPTCMISKHFCYPSSMLLCKFNESDVNLNGQIGRNVLTNCAVISKSEGQDK